MSKKYEMVQETMVIHDTWILPAYHDHICIDGEYFCLFFEEEEYEFTDTLYLEYYIPKKRFFSSK
jgi:hypothetical protein